MAARGPGRCFLVGAERTPLLGDENTRRTNANAGGAKSGSWVEWTGRAQPLDVGRMKKESVWITQRVSEMQDQFAICHYLQWTCEMNLWGDHCDMGSGVKCITNASLGAICGSLSDVGHSALPHTPECRLAGQGQRDASGLAATAWKSLSATSLSPYFSKCLWGAPLPWLASLPMLCTYLWTRRTASALPHTPLYFKFCWKTCTVSGGISRKYFFSFCFSCVCLR